MNYPKEIRTRDTIIRLREDGIVETRTIVTEQLRHELEDAKAVMEAVAEISENRLRPLLNILGDTYVTSAAQNYYRSQPLGGKASAMVVSSFMQRLVANIFLKYAKLPVPTKLFENEEKATAWLHTFLNDE